jgi:hypothetical protein
MRVLAVKGLKLEVAPVSSPDHSPSANPSME